MWGRFLLLLVLSQCGGEHTLLYGNMLGQTVENSSTSDPDVEEAVKLATKRANLAGVEYDVSNLSKKRLLFTLDGMAPFKFKSTDMSGGRVVVVQRQVVMGLLYSFQLHTPNANHHFTVSRDRNLQYHVFEHTTLVDGTVNHSSVATCLECGSGGGGGGGGDTGVCRSGDRILADVSLPPQFFHVGSPSTPVTQTLQVASYNIWNVNSVEDRGDAYEARLQRIKELITSLDADVFGFQEVRLEVTTPQDKRARHRGTVPITRCQVCDLAKMLPDYQFVYQPAMLYMERLLERKEEGVAIFSRFPMLSSDYRLLHRNVSDEEDTHQRICLHAKVYVPQLGLVHVFVTHLSLSERAQEIAAVEIWQYMLAHPGIRLLLGDMNAEPGSSTIRFLKGEQSISSVWTSELHDTWTATPANLDRPGFTFSALEEDLVKRIDYVFANLPDWSRVHITQSEVVTNSNICFLPCSDHHIVSTIFNFTII